MISIITNTEIQNGSIEEEKIIGKRTVYISRENRKMDICEAQINDKRMVVFERELFPSEIDYNLFILFYIVIECKKLYPEIKFPNIGEDITFIDKDNEKLRITGILNDSTHTPPRVSGIKPFIEHYDLKPFNANIGYERDGDIVRFYIDRDNINNQIYVKFIKTIQRKPLTTQTSIDTITEEDIVKPPEDIEQPDIAKQLEDIEQPDIAKQLEDIEQPEKNYNITEYLDSEDISGTEIDKIKALFEKDKSDIEAIINENKNQTLKLKIKEYQAKVKAEEEKEKKKILEQEQFKKEKYNRETIDKNLKNLSSDAKKAIENGTIFLEGPPGTSKTYDAGIIACKIANAYIVDKEKDLTLEELMDMGFVDRIELDSSWSSNDLMGGMTYHTKEEDKPADSIMPISKSGILTKMNKRNIGLALKLNKEEIESNPISKIFGKYKEMVRDKNLYKYAKRHILLVEEASRGNFESVFGGFMTLLEKERRLGEDNQTFVTNRSGYYYALAPSMIVICTRNIADKGAKSIDIGIMRRFPRRYKKPDFNRIENYINDKDNEEKLKNEGIYEYIKQSIEALKIINNRIVNHSQLGIDYQIGHTYLYVRTKSEFVSKWSDWILPSILDRCNRRFDMFSDILFGGDKPELIDKQKGIPEFENENIKGLNDFIAEIIGSDKDE